MDNTNNNTDLQVEEVEFNTSSPSVYRSLVELKTKLDLLLEDLKKTHINQERRNKNTVRKVRSEKVYNLNELHNEFIKKHQITESITERQLESYLQYYFDVNTGEMKQIKEETKAVLNLSSKDYQIIERAFHERKVNVVPRKEDIKYFVGLLENKKESVDFNGATYIITDPKSLTSNKELFTLSCNGDKIKPKTVYTMNPSFGEVLKEAGIIPSTFDTSKPLSELQLVELFNKYLYNQTQLYQPVDLKNREILTLLNVNPSNYVTLDYIYIKPKVLKEHLSNCCEEDNTLKSEVLQALEQFKVSTLATLTNKLKSFTPIE
jgi:hypothetical protein